MAYRVAQVDLSLNDVLPSGAAGILEISHEHVGAGIKRVDNHLALDRSGDLHAAVLQVARRWRDAPVAFPDMLSLQQKIRTLACIEFRLAGNARLHQFTAPAFKFAYQLGHKMQGLRREDLCKFGGDCAENGNAFRVGMEVAHRYSPCSL